MFTNRLLNDVQWTPAIENLVLEWKDTAARHREIHDQLALKLNKRHLWIGFPPMIANIIVAIFIFTVYDQDVEIRRWMLVTGGLLIVGSAAFTGLLMFLNYPLRVQQHLDMVNRFYNLEEEMKVQLTYGPKQRTPARFFVQQCQGTIADGRKLEPTIGGIENFHGEDEGSDSDGGKRKKKRSAHARVQYTPALPVETRYGGGDGARAYAAGIPMETLTNNDENFESDDPAGPA